MFAVRPVTLKEVVGSLTVKGEPAIGAVKPALVEISIVYVTADALPPIEDAQFKLKLVIVIAETTTEVGVDGHVTPFPVNAGLVLYKGPPEQVLWLYA